MAQTIYEFDPVTHITAGALGVPGHRTFYVQAQHNFDTISLLCEKQQVQALTEAIDEMVANLEEEFGITRHTDIAVKDADMAVKEPAEPLFRVGAMGLGYDANRDRILLIAQEAVAEDENRDPLEVRFFATRAQMQALAIYAKEVINRGRSAEQVAMQAEVHVRRNGHGE